MKLKEEPDEEYIEAINQAENNKLPIEFNNVGFSQTVYSKKLPVIGFLVMIMIILIFIK